MGIEWKKEAVPDAGVVFEGGLAQGEGTVRRGEYVGELPAYTLWQGLREYPKVWGPLLETRQASWPSQPLFHLVILSPDGNEARLSSTIASLTGQWYAGIRLSVIFGNKIPDGLVTSDKLDWHEGGESLLETANRILLEGAGDWVGLVSAGDELAPQALYYWAEAGFAHPGWEMAYSDEDRLGPRGRELPHFKPDFNLDLLRSHGYVGGVLLVRRGFFACLGGYNPALSGVEEHDLVLRAYEVGGARAIGHIPDVLYHRLNDGGYCRRPVNELVRLGRGAVQAHLDRLGVDAVVEEGFFRTSWRVAYRYPDCPKVSILVAGSGNLGQLQRCLESLLERTVYPDYEILVADAQGNGEVDAWLAQLAILGESRLRVHPVAHGLTASALFDALSAEGQGDYLVFLHGDCAVIQEDWLTGLVCHARRPEVGMVSPRLATAKGRLLDGCGVLGMGGGAASPFADMPLDDAGYWGRAHLEQNFSVLHGGCLVMEKALFRSLGGFGRPFDDDAQNISDLSLRMIQQGHLAVWTPFVTLLSEPVAVPPTVSWQDFLYKWRASLADDPAFNRNLGLGGSGGFLLDPRPEVGVDPLPWRPIPKILAHQADIFGCGEYRIIAPARALQIAGRAQTWTNFTVLNEAEIARLRPDAVVMQRPNEGLIPSIESYRKFGGAFMVYELDDLLSHLTLRSPARDAFTGKVVQGVMKAIAQCDRFVVSTPVLADLYRTLHADIRVMPNYLERARWGGFTPRRRQSERPRVGWAGGASHVGDLEMITDVVRELACVVDWVFFGLCPDNLRPYACEVHEGVPLPRYQDKLASLNLDLAIAPLEIHLFNEAKSNLRILEYGIMGYPVICTDIAPYRGDLPVTRVPNKHEAWVAAIREKLSDPDALAAEGDGLRRHVEESWMLEDHLADWLAAWLPG